MRLRARLALTVVAAAAPLLAGIVWLRGDLADRDARRALREFALARMESGGRDRCEADPEFFHVVSPPPAGLPGTGAGRAVGIGAGPAEALPPAPPPPPEGGDVATLPNEPPGVAFTELWAYRADFRSANPRAPEIPAAWRAAIAQGADDVSADVGTGDRAGGVSGRALLVRTPWPDGACAWVLVRRIDPEPGELASFPLWSAAALVAVMGSVVTFAAGRVVRRIRRLTDDVGRTAERRYAEPVTEAGADEIADLARAFNAAGREIRGHIEQMERREEALRAFLANTTHDVMTPLTVLQGHLSAIRRCAADGRPVDPETAGLATEEAHYLASLVHNLSAVAKLDAGLREVQLSPVRMNDAVQRVVERHWPLASPRAVEIVFAVPESDVWFDADVTLLEQAVSNVVGNAVRYNRPGGHVAVLLEEPGPGEFSLRVVDDGPGVPDDQLARLGSRGFRSDEARRRSPEGTGLGLDIVRRVAEFHRLKLAFRRSEHGGLEVEFRGARAPAPRRPPV